MVLRCVAGGITRQKVAYKSAVINSVKELKMYLITLYVGNSDIAISCLPAYLRLNGIVEFHIKNVKKKITSCLM